MVPISGDTSGVSRERIHIFKSHRLLSYLYSYFLLTSPNTGYYITAITTPEPGIYNVKAVKFPDDASVYHVLKIMVSTDPPLSHHERLIDFFTLDEDTERERNTLTERAILLDDSKKADMSEVSDLIGDLVVLSISDLSDNIFASKGGFSDRSLLSSLSQGKRNAFQIFPVPYVPGMNPMITISFLTQNFTATGWRSQREVISEAAEFAHRFSPYLDMERLLIDMQVVMKICIRIGLFREDGDMVYMPRSRARAQTWFFSRYEDYLKRMGRRTLYDYSSLG